MNGSILLGGLMAILFSFSAYASPIPSSQSAASCKTIFDSCIQKKNWLNLECIDSNYEHFDKQLNTTYKRLILLKKKSDYYPDRELELLKSVQRAWIKFRDTTCHFESGLHPGSGWGWGLRYNSCLLEMTCKRINYLENHLQNISKQTDG
jgi:uncharacterized protein YecT (DUF1311 family)